MVDPHCAGCPCRGRACRVYDLHHKIVRFTPRVRGGDERGGNVSFFDLLSALFFLLLFLKFIIGRGGGVTTHRVYVNVLLVITSYVLDGECVSYALGRFRGGVSVGAICASLYASIACLHLSPGALHAGWSLG